MRLAPLTASLFISMLATFELQAQVSAIDPGTRVRISYDCRRILFPSCSQVKGTLDSLTADSIVVTVNGTTRRSFGRRDVAAVDVSRGQRSRVGAGIGRGFVIGLVLGAGIGYGIGDDCSGSSGGGGLGFDFCFDRRVTTGVLGLAGGLTGILIGAAAGAATKGEAWERAEPRQWQVLVGPRRDGRFRLGASVRF